MATFDSADLLDRLRDAVARPATDQVLTTDRGYRLLSDAQREVGATIAQHIPWTNYTAPVQLVTSDSKLYSLPSSGRWIGRILVMRDLVGEPLIEGSYDDQAADYTMEGDGSIRITADRTWDAPAPYVRYMAALNDINGSGNEPTLKPIEARQAVVMTAAAMFARRGGLRDPQPYLDEVYACLWGREGWAAQPGLIPSYKNQQSGLVTSGQPWWRGVGTIR